MSDDRYAQAPSDVLTLEECERAGVDGTGTDGDPRFPHRFSTLTLTERRRLTTPEPGATVRCIRCGALITTVPIVAFVRDGLDFRPTDARFCLGCGSNQRNVLTDDERGQ